MVKITGESRVDAEVGSTASSTIFVSGHGSDVCDRGRNVLIHCENLVSPSSLSPCVAGSVMAEATVATAVEDSLTRPTEGTPCFRLSKSTRDHRLQLHHCHHNQTFSPCSLSRRLLEGGSTSGIADDEEGLCASVDASSSSSSSDGRISTIRYRPLRENDKSEIKTLHESWFPVRYKNNFYESIVTNHMSKSGDPIFSSVAVDVDAGAAADMADTDVYDECEHRADDDIVCSSPAEPHSLATPLEHQSPLLHENGIEHDGCRLGHSDCLLEHNLRNREKERIVGCVVGAFFHCDRVGVDTTSLLIRDLSRHSLLFYIMTLGTVTEFRQRGLGTALVRRCLDVAEREPRCGAVYLHVITYNTAAIRFYEKLGFVRVDEIDDYYSINGENYNCFLYAKYLHGNRGHGSSLSIFTLLFNVVTTVWRIFSLPFYSAYTSFRIKSS